MWGPVGQGEVTMADDSGGRMFPSFLLTFGTLVVRGGWQNHGTDYDPSGLYGTIEGDLVIQLIEVNTRTPVVVQRASLPLRPIMGDYPGDGFRLRAVKLDATRLFVTWHRVGAQWGVVVSVLGGQVTFGAPVNFGDEITISSSDGRPEFFPTQLRTIRQEDIVALSDGKVAYTGIAENYNDPDQTNSLITRVGCRLTTSGLEVTGYQWFWLDAGFPEYGVMSYAESSAAAIGLGGDRELVIFNERATYPTDTDTMAYLTLIDWSVTPPTVQREQLVHLARWGISTDGERAFVSQVNDILVAPLDDPLNYDLVPYGQDYEWEAPLGASWQSAHLAEATPRGGWLGIGQPVQGGDSVFAEVFFTGGTSFISASPVPVLVDALPLEYYGWTASPAGGRYAVLLVDFEEPDPPYNYREFLYIYEYVRTGDISAGPSSAAFLQVRGT